MERLRPQRSQIVFSGTTETTLPEAEADPARTPFAVVAGGRVVGFGVLDRDGILRDLVDDTHRAVLLRGFYLGAAHQGRGWGTAAARAVPALAASVHPGVELVVLTVNDTNTAARRAYAAAGFVETGTRYLAGPAGPQQVMVARARR